MSSKILCEMGLRARVTVALKIAAIVLASGSPVLIWKLRYHWLHYKWQWRHKERNGVLNHRVPIVCLTVWRRSKKLKAPTSLAFERGIHRWPVDSPHKGPWTRKMFSFDDVIMNKFCHVAVEIQALCRMQVHSSDITIHLGPIVLTGLKWDWGISFVLCWDVITHPCPNFNGGKTNPLRLGYDWGIT